MVNSYCGSLDTFFSELVFYGILKTEDAQCFSIKSVIEEGFFILVIGSILLALVNGIVGSATMQYLRDQNSINRKGNIQEFETEMQSTERIYEGDDNSSELTINPPPVLFTDTFRWLLELNYTEQHFSVDSNLDEGRIDE